MNLKQKNGISLIVLVITIVVMIILSGTIVSSLDISTENADFSVFANDIAQLQESARAMYIMENKLPIADNAVKIERADILNLVSSENETLFEEELTLNGESEDAYFYILDLAKAGAGEVEYGTGVDGADDIYVISANSLKVYYLKGVEYDGNMYFSINSKMADIINLPDTTLDESSLDITVTPFEPSQSVTNSPTTYYGAKVTNYKTGNTAIDSQVEWQIFYADTNNIYLIATDYVHYDLLPKVRKTNADGTVTEYALNKGDGDYNAYFTNILPAYNGSKDITNARLQALNKSYHDYLITNNTISENPNMKAVAYMLDANVWERFAGAKAEYAIGGPTVELLMKSYSQKCGVDYRAQATSVTGYEMSIDGGISWADYYNGMLNTNDTQYVINASTRKANAMWQASPSDDSSNCVMNVGYNGYVSFSRYDRSHLGFRPIVCLNSSVKLRPVNGGYAIV